MEIRDIRFWSSPEVHTIEVRPGFEDIGYALKVRKFIPKAGDLLHQAWWNGTQHCKHSTPSFAIADMREAAVNIKAYVDSAIETSVGSLLSNEDVLLKETYRSAMHHAKSSPVR